MESFVTMSDIARIAALPVRQSPTGARDLRSIPFPSSKSVVAGVEHSTSTRWSTGWKRPAEDSTPRPARRAGRGRSRGPCR